jgi:hypothetical protein
MYIFIFKIIYNEQYDVNMYIFYKFLLQNIQELFNL